MKVLYHHRTSAQDGSAVHIDGLVGALRKQQQKAQSRTAGQSRSRLDQ